MAFFNPFRPGYLEDPYPALARLRSQEPVHWSSELDAWVVTSYAECLRVIQDEEAFSSDPANAGGTFGVEVTAKRAQAPLGMAPIMGNSDAPDHTRLRAIVNRGFTPRVIEAMRPGIERAADALLAEIPDDKPFDVMKTFAEPLAVTIVLDHLGVPRGDIASFRQWSLAIMQARAEGGGDPSVVVGAENARGEMLDYLARLAEGRDSTGNESPLDIVAVLLDACDDEALRPEEMLMMLIHISLAGNGPTAMALGNSVAALAAHPQAARTIAGDRDALGPAVEELLRFDSSTHFVARFAIRDAKVGARTVRAGQQVHAMVGAANRDPARFENPDALELSRTDNRHLSFGYGVHFCLGAPLARLEMQVALQRFCERFKSFEVVEERRALNYQLRGHELLTVRVQANSL